MIQSKEFDSNMAFLLVKREIKDLMEFDGEDKQDDVMYAVNKLTAVLRIVYENYQFWSSEVLREFVLSQNDPLRNLDFKSDKLNNTVRKIQQDIIIQFS